MTAPMRSGGHGTIHHVATTALPEAEELERQGRDQIARGVEMLRTAAVMRGLHAVVPPLPYPGPEAT